MMVPWIKITHTTFDKPEVYQIAEILNINPGVAFEKLCRVWVWVDQHTVDGKAANLTKTLLDSYTNLTGFCQAMLDVGWLEPNGDIGYQLPHFDRHNGETAKKRDTNARDVANHRARKSAEQASKENVSSATLQKGKKCKGGDLTSTLQKPDLDEDEDEETLSTNVESVAETADAVASEQEASDSVTAAQFVMTSWNAVGPVRSSRLNDKLKSAIKTRLRSPWWAEHWLQALEKVPDCGFLNGDGPRGWKADFAWFLKQNSVQEIIDGKYDTQPTAATAPKSASTTRFTNTISALEQWVIDSTARLDGVRENDCPSLGSEVDH